jgi:membrane fusion protein (multidrug efflux system)
VHALLLLSLLACSDGSKDKHGGKDDDPPPDPRTLVEVAPISMGEVADYVVASAAVESESQAAVVPEAQGLVTAVFVEEGDTVAAGDALAVLASPQLDAAYERAATEFDHARAERTAAERLHGQGAIAKSELDAAKRAHDVARTALDEASKTRGFTRLVAPIAGAVATKNVRYGEVASPAQPAFTVVDPARLRVVVHIPERELGRVRLGQPALIQGAYEGSGGGSGRVTRISPVVDAATGTVRVNVALDAASTLRPGQYVSVRIEVDRRRDVLTVARRSLVYEDNKTYVFTLGEPKPKDEDSGEPEGDKGWFSFLGGDEKDEDPEPPGPKRAAHREPVSVGLLDGEIAELLDGPPVGTPVVTVGSSGLRDDALVRLPEDPRMTASTEDEGKKGS